MLTRTLLFATLVALTPPAIAKSKAVPAIPLSQKYSDHGAKPTRVVVGAAEFQAQAVVDGSERTHVALAIPPGTIDKVQVKTFRGDRLRSTDNYSKGLGSSTASFDYAGLMRGDRVEVQANVKASARGPTSVVTASTVVAMAPDLEPGAIAVPASVEVGKTIPVVGRVRETNGDMGARFDCRLYLDDVAVGTIPGAWVDAGMEIACQFTVKLASPGAHKLVLRAENVSPNEYDAGNNAVLANVEAVYAPFDNAYAFYDRWWTQQGYRTTFYDFISHTVDETSSLSDPQWQQYYGMNATLDGEIGMDGRVALRHSMDGTELEGLEAAVADLDYEPEPGCHDAHFERGGYVLMCLYEGKWYFQAQRINGSNWLYTDHGYFEAGPQVPEGSRYSAELTYVAPNVARRAARTADIAPVPSQSWWTDPSCQYYSSGWGFVAEVCTTQYYASQGAHGYADAP